MSFDEFKKKCDCCSLYLNISGFYKNKSKSDGLQNKCKDCIKDYKVKLKQGLIERPKKIEKELYFIPDIYIVGVGRTQTFQNCCLNCEKGFFCSYEDRRYEDLFCDFCEAKEMVLPEKNTSKTNYIGNVVGWKVMVDVPSINRSNRNYKKVYERDRYTCQYCNYTVSNSKEFLPLHIDHIKPWTAKGGNGLNNLVVSCSTCNLIAHNKWFPNFEDKKEFILYQRKRKHLDKKDLLNENKTTHQGLQRSQ